MGKLTPAKARKILQEGRARGKPLTARQKRFFGLIAGGGKPTKLKRTKRRTKRRRKRRKRGRKKRAS